MTERKLMFALTEAEIEQLMTRIAGQGGWQSLMRNLQESLRGNELLLDWEDFDKVWRYLRDYGMTGGWQQRIPKSLRDAVGDRVGMSARQAAHERIEALRKESQFLANGFRKLDTFDDLLKLKPPVDLVLRELERQPCLALCSLLAVLTGEDPVPEGHRYNPNKAPKAWLRWGKRKGHLGSSNTDAQ